MYIYMSGAEQPPQDRTLTLQPTENHPSTTGERQKATSFFFEWCRAGWKTTGNKLLVTFGRFGLERRSMVGGRGRWLKLVPS